VQSKKEQHTESTLTAKTRNSSLPHSVSATPEDLPPLKLYQNINRLPFTVFLEITDTKDLSLLITQGEATEAELVEAWDKLYAEYHDACNNGEDDSETREVKSFATSYNKVCRARVLLDSIVAIGTHETLIEQLYAFGYDLPENNGKNMERIVALFTANHKRDYIDLQTNTLQREEEQQEATVIDGNYYMNTIAIMIASLKCSIDINSLTLGLYVALIKQYKQHCKSLLKLQNHGS